MTGTPRWYDVSNNNGQTALGTVPSSRPGDPALQFNVDAGELAGAGAEGLFIKATEGSWFVDRFAAGNLKTAVGAGMQAGLYHFAHPGKTDPKSAAVAHAATVRTLCAQAGVDPRSILHALDLELAEAVLGNPLAGWCVTFMRTVEDELGLAPNSIVFYSYRAFITDNLGQAAGQLTSWRLWLAAYQSQTPSAAPWTGMWMWQHTDVAAVPGVRGEVDENFRLGPLDQQEVDAVRPFKLQTPDGQGAWYVTTNGAVYTLGSATYWGGLNNHPDWDAGGPSDPVVDVMAFADPKGPGYTIVTLDAKGTHVYSFGPSHNYA